MKRIIVYVFGVIAVIALIAAGYFYWRIWPGLRPAIGPRPNVARKTFKPTPGAINATGLPLTIPAGFKIDFFATGLGSVRFLAFHGSWNRSVPTGYKVVRFDLSGPSYDQVGKQIDFITGWLTPDGALGRPVDVIQGSDDALYISDDKSGAIYRVTKL